MQPLATHMVDRRLVRARGYTGVPVRHLDLGLLREREPLPAGAGSGSWSITSWARPFGLLTLTDAGGLSRYA